MNYEFSNHAQEELKNRHLSQEVVESILQSPQQIIDEDNLKVYQGKFIALNGKTYLLRIYVNKQVNPYRVVTLYKTSKINKY